MHVNIDSTIARGGEPLVELLKYCVFCREMDVMFLMLARNYQMLPSADKAMAIYDTFQTRASALAVSGDIPVDRGDSLLLQSIATIADTQSRIVQRQSEPPADEEEMEEIAPFLPPRYLFDASIDSVRSNSVQIGRIEREYNPELGAFENLPEKTLNAVQLSFIEQRWKPARAALSRAGFYMVANIAG